MPKKKRSIWLTLHLYVGILCGLPLLVVGLTGGILAFRPELQQWTLPQLYEVEAQGERLPPEEVARRMKEAYPETTLLHTTAFKEEGRAWITYIGGGRLIVDPYTGEARQATGDWTKVMEQVHRNLTAGTIGRYIVGGSSLLLILISLSGFVLWWPMRGGTIRRFFRKQSALGWHNVAGLASLPLILVMALTGITLTFGGVVIPIVFTVTGSPPLPDKPTSTASASADAISLVEAIQVAQHEVPDATITGFAEPWSEDDVYKIHLGHPGELNRHGWEKLFIDPQNGAVVGRLDAYGHSLGSIYKHAWGQVHTGELFGLFGRMTWGIASLFLPLLFVTGVIRWWKKHRHRWSR